MPLLREFSWQLSAITTRYNDRLTLPGATGSGYSNCHLFYVPAPMSKPAAFRHRHYCLASALQTQDN